MENSGQKPYAIGGILVNSLIPNSKSLASGIFGLIQSGQFTLAILGAVTLVLVPNLCVLQRLGNPKTKAMRRVASTIRDWNLLGVFLIAVAVVALLSQRQMVKLTPGWGFAGLLCCVVALSSMPHVVLRHLFAAWQRLAERLKHEDRLEAPATWKPLIAIGLSYASLFCFVWGISARFCVYNNDPANPKTITVLSGIHELYTSGYGAVAVFAALVSVVFPVSKSLAVCMYVHLGFQIPSHYLTTLSRLGPWSMFDVYIVMMLAISHSCFHLLGYSLFTIAPASGFYVYVLAILLNSLALQCLKLEK